MNEIDQIRRDKLEVLKKHVAQIMEHFDTVQVVCTFELEDGGGTMRIGWGDGNWYARESSLRGWLLVEEEREREQIRQQEQEHDDAGDQ